MWGEGGSKPWEKGVEVGQLMRWGVACSRTDSMYEAHNVDDHHF